MPGENIKVLIVDDEKSVRDFLLRFFKLQHIECVAVEDGPLAIESAKKEKFDLVFLDLRMPKMSGLQVFSELKKINPQSTFIFMTGYAIEAMLLDSTAHPPAVCLRKPFEDIKHIKDIVENFMRGTEIQVPAQDRESVTDRRAFIRLDIVLDVDYKVKEVRGPFVHSFSRDIAPGGIKLMVQEKLEIGTALEIIMRVLGCSAVCKATGEVVWITESQGKPGYYEAGIKLTQVDFSDLANLLISCGKIQSKNP